MYKYTPTHIHIVTLMEVWPRFKVHELKCEQICIQNAERHTSSFMLSKFVLSFVNDDLNAHDSITLNTNDKYGDCDYRLHFLSAFQPFRFSI